ncbi:Glutamate--tRNA ligase [bioreactor metagenome]|uniref:glutamate--tRNA ligase n=1 Tax=bioreactor metagenome TaxID=1076179 RepID=A0A645AEJ7_9ZZZZ
MSKVRTRFAPSPTGYMHVGNLRTALYAYLIARKAGGTFILRIEDTDQERQKEGAVELIYRTLAETGLTHDEGPDVGGPYAPYVQSERRDIYKKYALELVDKGAAYYCFCDKERLEEVRLVQEVSGQPTKYDGHCRGLSKEEVAQKLAAGLPYVIRQKIPEGTTTFEDAVFGTVRTPNESLDDNVLLKTDGLPTYNFANVVDDHLMEISHVVRGTEYLSSAPKYNLLYEAFGWPVPIYVHCPPVMKDQHSKLSKRNGDASYEDLIAQGFLKEAVLNYIALLGWSPGGEKEVFTLPEMIEAFDIAGISKSPSIFDRTKLEWLNGEYIRRLTPAEFAEMARPYIEKAVKNADVEKLAALVQPRCLKLTDIAEQLDFVDKLPDYDIELYVHKKMKTDKDIAYAALKELLPALEGVGEWKPENIHATVFALIEKLGLKNGQVLWPLRTALSGKAFTPGGGIELADLLGKDESIARVKTGIELLEKA